MESDSFEQSDDSDGWIAVASDGDDYLSLSDSDDESSKKKERSTEPIPPPEESRVSSLATTKVSLSE